MLEFELVRWHCKGKAAHKAHGAHRVHVNPGGVMVRAPAPGRKAAPRRVVPGGVMVPAAAHAAHKAHGCTPVKPARQTTPMRTVPKPGRR